MSEVRVGKVYNPDLVKSGDCTVFRLPKGLRIRWRERRIDPGLPEVKICLTEKEFEILDLRRFKNGEKIILRSATEIGMFDLFRRSDAGEIPGKRFLSK